MAAPQVPERVKENAVFVEFFLYAAGNGAFPSPPLPFLRLQKALKLGVIHSMDDFYTAARAILVKSERYFDTYDQVFAHFFRGITLLEPEDIELTEIAKALLQEWLKNPAEMAQALGLDEKKSRP